MSISISISVGGIRWVGVCRTESIEDMLASSGSFKSAADIFVAENPAVGVLNQQLTFLLSRE